MGGEGGHTLSVFLEKQITVPFPHKYALLFLSDVVFCWEKPPDAEHAEGLAQGSGSLVVRSTDVGPNFSKK